LPKPLLPVVGEPVVGHTLRQLAKIGCETAVLNLHHLAASIPASLGKIYHGMPLRYSEEPEILGTLGALVPPRSILRDADVVILVNGDSLCAWPFKQLLRRHLDSRADVTLLLHRRQPSATLGGGVGLDRAGAVVQLRDMEPLGEVATRHIFAGVHLLSPQLLDRLPEGPGEIIADLYMPLMAEGRKIVGYVTRRRWQDLGAPDRYLAACLQQGRQPWWKRRRSTVSPLATVGDRVILEGSILEGDCHVDSGVRVHHSLLLAGCRIGKGSSIQDSIIGPGVQLPAATRIDKRMINRLTVAHQPSDKETVMGDLIYTPLS
jgi:mannose-1-phosphate guanylyltransferase